ncbi:Cache sensor protein [Mongoliibacter ruber]|uniref:Cache domain-containing protein n=1 Tax=Mongoliibacter ruber TaxID=1750599 RepID=A0A2T0WK63_9BACT|nr:Cache sensor protein [Mongoliibacter ruber]PRY87100.1 hypothetical protein CLW00_107169 [Mongoliibacter ruber]
MDWKRLIYAFFFLALLACSQPKTEKFQVISLELNSFVKLLEYDLANLEKEIVALGDTIEYLFQHQDSILALADNTLYRFENGIANSMPAADPNLSTLYISTLAPSMEEAMKLIYLTNPTDQIFKSIFEKYDVISQVYMNSNRQFNRLYPPFEAIDALEPDLDIPSFNFYYEADEVHNPERSSTWVKEIYIDPAGRGWVASLLHPVYVEDDLMMVLGFDITVNDLIEIYLNNSTRNLVIIDPAGTVVAGKSKAIEALSLPPLKNHTYNQTITSNSYRPEDFNLFRSKSKTVRKIASSIILSKEKNLELKDGDESFKIIVNKVENLDWFVLDLIFE